MVIGILADRGPPDERLIARPATLHAARTSTRLPRKGAVRRDDGTVTLRVGEERRQILVAPEAEIRIDDFWGTFADIKEGQRVRASLDETRPQAEGYRIQILDKGARPGTTDQRKSSGRGAAPGAPKSDRR